MLRSSFGLCALALSFGGLLAGSVSADTVSLDASNDTWIRDGFSHASNGTDGVLDMRFSFTPYIQFDLSGLNIDQISSATLTVHKVASARNDTIVNGRFAVHGLPSQAGNTLQNWDELADFDPTDATNGLDFRNVGADHTLNTGNGVNLANVINLDAEDGANVTEVTNNTTGVATLTGQDLVNFLNSRVDDNGLVTFIFGIEGVNTGQGWGYASKENADANLHPQLDLEFTQVPEPGSLALIGLGSLLALRRRRF